MRSVYVAMITLVALLFFLNCFTDSLLFHYRFGIIIAGNPKVLSKVIPLRCDWLFLVGILLIELHSPIAPIARLDQQYLTCIVPSDLITGRL